MASDSMLPQKRLGQTVSVLGGVVQDVCTIIDRIPDDGESVVASGFSMAPGGKGSNAAVAVHRLTRPNPKNTQPPADEVEEHPTEHDQDVHVRMVGAVGGDQYGPKLKQNLEDCGVNVEDVRVVDGQPTAVANILLEADTKENRVMQYLGVNEAFGASDFETAESLGGGIVPDLIICQLELGRGAIEQAIETAGLHRIDVLLNPAPASYLMPDIYPYVTHLVMNETEAVLLSEIERDEIKHHTGRTKVADSFRALGVKNVVITLGAKGAFYSNEEACGTVEAETNCSVMDTSGAGDSFVGGYTAEYLKSKSTGNWDIESAVQKGCKAAARVIEHLGCLEPICWADEIDIPRSN
ncbi:MAG: hypothetical protein Q9178_005022 [Gyalolechia marmorata]